MRAMIARPPGLESRAVRVLLLDDDVELADLVGEYLGREGFALDAEVDGTRAAERVGTGGYQLLILDVMLPGISGFDILRSIRSTSRIPVLMLTARGDDVDRIVGLELGADDYLSKPFNPRELVARIRAILRRTQVEATADPGDRPLPRLCVDDVEMDFGRRLVTRAGMPIELTAVEFSLLEVLLRAVGSVVKREELARTVLGRTLTPFDRSLDVHVSHLRKKLGPRPDGRERITTFRAVGYMCTRSGDTERP